MNRFTDTAQIEKQHLHKLSNLIGKNICKIYSFNSFVDIKWPIVFSSCFGINVKNSCWVEVTNEWRKTPFGVHYGKMNVSDRTHDVSKYSSDLGSISLEPVDMSFPIYQIDILEREITKEYKDMMGYDSERIQYDAAVVFKRKGSSSFRLGPEKQITGRVEFCQLWSDIRDISAHLKRRVMITEEGIDFDPPRA